MANLGTLNRDVEVNNNPAGGGGVTLLADGVYQLEITESEVKAAQTGKGQNLDMKVQVYDGDDKGVWFFAGITSIQHESNQAQTIAQGQLKALCMACGVDYSTLEDSEALHFQPFHAQVGRETYFSKKHNKDMTKNVVLKYLFGEEDENPALYGGGKSAAQPPADKPAAQQQTTQQGDAGGGQKRTWQRKTA